MLTRPGLLFTVKCLAAAYLQLHCFGWSGVRNETLRLVSTGPYYTDLVIDRAICSFVRLIVGLDSLSLWSPPAHPSTSHHLLCVQCDNVYVCTALSGIYHSSSFQQGNLPVVIADITSHIVNVCDIMQTM